MITHIVSDWLFSPCCIEHQDEFIFERVAVAYSRDYNEVGRAQIKLMLYCCFSEVTSEISLVTSNDVILDIDVISGDLKHMILKYDKSLKHDNSDFMVCSGVPKLAPFTVKINLII